MKQPVQMLLRGRQFKKLAEKEMSELRQKYGLNRMEIEVISVLLNCGEHNTLVEVQAALNANKGHLSQTVDQLCKKGLIYSEQDESDRRYVHYYLKDSINELANDIDSVWNRLKKDLFEGVSQEDLDCFERVANQIGLNMKKHIE